MISNIVKRDGRTEPFSAEKVNGWGIWASKSLGGFVDWSSVVMQAVAKLPEETTSEKLQQQLIRECLDAGGWAHQRMAGRLYASLTRKELYNASKEKELPSVKELHERLIEKGYMVKLDYSDEEYKCVEEIIKHERDYKYAWSQLQHIRSKYALRDHVSGVEFESAQFTFMRMAMALAEDEPKKDRLHHLKQWYDHLSNNRLNAPTPNFVNLGTPLNGYASCCLYYTDDDEDSMEVGDHIARKMTVMSAGIGGNINSRSLGDPVRGGRIRHQGKLPYFNALSGAVRSSMQNGRGGACTTYVSAYDPEIATIIRLKHPMSPEDKRIRTIDYGIAINKHLARKARLNEDIFLFNIFTAPDLNEALYSGEAGKFERIYAEYEANPDFKKTYVSARKLVIDIMTMGYETGRLYLFMADEANINTPFLDPIHSSNLCAEILEPTEAYLHMTEVYKPHAIGHIKIELANLETVTLAAPGAVDVMRDGKKQVVAAQDLRRGDTILDNQYVSLMFDDGPRTFQWPHGKVGVYKVVSLRREPEVALCSLAAIVVPNISSPEEYESVAYYALKMIDKCIHKSDYPLEHVGYTAKSRLNAGVGTTGLAHHLARKKLKYTSEEGKREAFRMAELHMYSLLKASLRLGKELGNAPWMHRTKWPQGWLPIDHPSRIKDELGFEYEQDWEGLRAQIIENKGLRFSCHAANMPVESSSKASGCSNADYPVRGLTLSKTDGGNTIDWAAPDSDKLQRWYQLAWDIPYQDMVHHYALKQHFTDQSSSADFWRRLEDDETITDDEMLDHFTLMVKYGMKTRYYQNTKVSSSRMNTTGSLFAIHAGPQVQTLSASFTVLTEEDWLLAEAANDLSLVGPDGTLPSGVYWMPSKGIKVIRAGSNISLSVLGSAQMGDAAIGGRETQREQLCDSGGCDV